MAKFERLEPRADDMPVFDGSVDEEEAEEGSRLPLLIVIALLVLAAFAGVVYLAYTQGVERGRADAPRVVVAQASGTKLKVYQQPAPADEEGADADSVPAPPTPVANPPAQPAPANQNATATERTTPSPQAPSDLGSAAASAPATTPAPTSTETAAASSAGAKPSKKIASAAPAPQIATHAPAPLVAPAENETANVPPPAKPETTESQASPATTETPAKSQAGGSALLQIGSYKSQDEADTAWTAFKGKYPDVDSYTSNVKQVDLGAKGVWYRLRIGPFADKDAATSFCTKLKADGASCLVAR